ncbi:MAG: TerB family tellurite resistance protein [Alphaproteobacteria bacterium]|nr:TerB family tellurite resistance protein [Alphaproteobacteria bacterium]
MNDDYINELSMLEKTVFLKLFCKMIKADSTVDNDEIDFLKMIAARYGVDNATLVGIIKETDSINVSAEAAQITNRYHSLQLIKELCVLANIDDDLHDNELDIVIDAARAMNVEDDKVVLINRWVLDSLILSKTGKIIMEEENA